MLPSPTVFDLWFSTGAMLASYGTSQFLAARLLRHESVNKRLKADRITFRIAAGLGRQLDTAIMCPRRSPKTRQFEKIRIVRAKNQVQQKEKSEWMIFAIPR